MWDQDRDDLNARYRARWCEYGYDPRALGWNKDCQWVRFEAALEGLREKEFASIVDVGCGFGDFLVYLRQKGWQGRYVGVDLVDELIGEARKRHKRDGAATFFCGDIQHFSPTERSDMAVALGIFNHRLRQDNLEFVRETIAKMWDISSAVVVCDFLSMSSDVGRREESLYYADPCRLYELAARYTRRVMIHHAYMPFELQMKIWHEDSFEPAAPVFRPYEHLASAQTDWRKRSVTDG